MCLLGVYLDYHLQSMWGKAYKSHVELSHGQTIRMALTVIMHTTNDGLLWRHVNLQAVRCFLAANRATGALLRCLQSWTERHLKVDTVM